MFTIWLYSLGSVLAVSLMSLIGIATFIIQTNKLKEVLIYMIAFSAGALLGDAFIHLLPEAIGKQGLALNTSLFILTGIAVSFVVEKIIHWRHCHQLTTADHPHPYALMNLFGDVVHNFIDGLIIGAAYLVSIPVGIATTLAVILHEIPQEIGDFGVLINGGFTRGKALFLNFMVALSSVLGVVIALIINAHVANMTTFLVPFAAGSFIYIASADLIPEMHKQVKVQTSLIQFFWFLLGVGLMISLLYLGE